jgi:hypothetical protein
MIAALRKLAQEEIDQETKCLFENTANYLEACHFIFEKGSLSHKLVKTHDSIVVENIKKGFTFFKEWCYNHQQIGKLHIELEIKDCYIILII